MTEVGRFFDGVLYTEADQAEVQNRLRREGVLPSIGVELFVTAPGGMFVSVASGEAMVQGFWYKNTASKNLAIATNTSGSTRIDRIVLRLLRVANSITAVVVQGTPGGGLPAITQVAGGDWDYPIATVTVPTATTTSITTGMIANVGSYSQTVASSKEIAAGSIFASQIALGGQINKSALDYTLPSDVSLSLSAGTWTNVFAPQLYNIEDANSLIEVYAHGVITVTSATVGAQISSRLIVQNSTLYGPLGGGIMSSASGWVNALAGSGMVPIANIGVGNFQIQIQVYTSHSATMTCRPVTYPNIEGVSLNVRERKR
jgi:hypothetical protein